MTTNHFGPPNFPLVGYNRFGAVELTSNSVRNKSNVEGRTVSDVLNNLNNLIGSREFEDGVLGNATMSAYFKNDNDTGFNRTAAGNGTWSLVSNGVSELIIAPSTVIVNSALEVGSTIRVNTDIANKNILQSDGSGVFRPLSIAAACQPGSSITSLALGQSAGSSMTSGTNNLTIGYQAGSSLTTGIDNVLLGAGSTAHATGTSTSVAVGSGTTAASNSVVLGSGASSSSFTGGIAIGMNATSNANNQLTIRVGDSNSTTLRSTLAIDTNAHTTLAAYLPVSIGGTQYYIPLYQ